MVFNRTAAPEDADILLRVLILLDPDVANMGSPVYPRLRQKMEDLGWDPDRFYVAINKLKLSERLFLSRSRKTVSLKPIHLVRRKTERRRRQKCVYCGITTIKLTRDHVIPKSKGGTNAPENMVWACLACNLSKAARTPEEWASDVLAYRQRVN